MMNPVDREFTVAFFKTFALCLLYTALGLAAFTVLFKLTGVCP